MASASKPVFPGGYDPPGMTHGQDYVYTTEVGDRGPDARWEDDMYVDSNVKVCPRCDGTGRDWTTPQGTEVCPKCGGSGEVSEHGDPWWSEHETFPEDECTRCGGLGSDPDNEDDVCRACGGTGEESSPATSAADTHSRPVQGYQHPEGTPCGRCRKGQRDIPADPKCDRCKGSGNAPAWTPTSWNYSKAPVKAPAPPAPRTWENMPWGPATSKQFAKSKNVFVRMTGLARDVMDNYWSCPVDRHWGPRGGAGVIPFTVIDGQVMVLMSHRGNFVEQGGTWSSFGGAIDPGDKSPFAGAVRETFEEVDGLPGKGDVVANFKRPCHACGWTYHTFVIRVKGDPKSLLKAKVRAGHSAWETQGVAWVPVNLVGYYDLHPGFAKTWPEARQAIMKAVKEGKTTRG